MRIEIIQNKYKLPFNRKKPIKFLKDYIEKTGDILVVYIIIENNKCTFYSITKCENDYCIVRHRYKKFYRDDHKASACYIYESWIEAVDQMKEIIEGIKSQESNTIIEIIQVKEDI